MGKWLLTVTGDHHLQQATLQLFTPCPSSGLQAGSFQNMSSLFQSSLDTEGLSKETSLSTTLHHLRNLLPSQKRLSQAKSSSSAWASGPSESWVEKAAGKRRVETTAQGHGPFPDIFLKFLECASRKSPCKRDSET